jgi:hypothetical protein
MNKISDELMVLSFQLELVDEREIVQKLYQHHPNKEKIYFYYLRNERMEEENSLGAQGASL